MICAVLGDSIAVGTGYAMPECRTTARVGISSPAYASTYTAHVNASLAVISLGSNDGRQDTTESLEAVRSRITADRVVWLLPAVGARDAVRAVAARHGDRVIAFTPGADGIHPGAAGYRDIASQAMSGRTP